MLDYVSVLLKIAAMFLVMAVGWLTRRANVMSDETGRSLSRLLVDVTYPALVFTQLLKTVSSQSLRASWSLPIIGILILVLAALVGLLAWPLARRRGNLATVIFLVATPNWIYLPLPIVEGLFGANGVRDVLLYNVGCQIALWSMGIWILNRGRWDVSSLKNLALNPGLLATGAGIVLALIFPAARELEKVTGAGHSPLMLSTAVGVQALSMLGSLTIPLSLLVTGLQLGNLNLLPGKRLEIEGVLVLFLRLVMAPAVTLLLFQVVAWLGFTLPETARITGYLIACMPVAISCSVLTDRYGGDTQLAARSIFYSTLWSMLTVPAWFYFLNFART